jgi:hypothetical protein
MALGAYQIDTQGNTPGRVLLAAPLFNLKRLPSNFLCLQHTASIQVSSDYVEAFEQIIKAYSRIGESLTRFGVLNEIFSQNMEFQQTLAVFYADILLFHKEAYKFVRCSCKLL